MYTGYNKMNRRPLAFKYALDSPRGRGIKAHVNFGVSTLWTSHSENAASQPPVSFSGGATNARDTRSWYTAAVHNLRDGCVPLLHQYNTVLSTFSGSVCADRYTRARLLRGVL